MFTRCTKLAAVTLAALLCLGLLGCVPLDDALSDPMLAEADTGLCGAWESVDDQGKNFVIIEKSKGEKGTPPGLMQFSFITKEGSVSSLYVTTTEIQGSRYGNILLGEVNTGKGYEDWKRKSGVAKCQVFKYQVKDDKIALWDADAGTIPDWEKEKVYPAKKFVDFIKSNGDGKVFPDTKSLSE